MFCALNIGKDVGAQRLVRRIVRGLGVGLDTTVLRERYWDGTVAEVLEFKMSNVGLSVKLEDWRQLGFDFTTPLHADPAYNKLAFFGGTHGSVKRFIEWFLDEQIVPPFDSFPFKVVCPVAGKTK